MPSAAPNQRAANQRRREARDVLGRQVLLRQVEFDAALRSPPAVADGVLYIATENTLYAIGKRK